MVLAACASRKMRSASGSSMKDPLRTISGSLSLRTEMPMGRRSWVMRMGIDMPKASRHAAVMRPADWIAARSWVVSGTM